MFSTQFERLFSFSFLYYLTHFLPLKRRALSFIFCPLVHPLKLDKTPLIWYNQPEKSLKTRKGKHMHIPSAPTSLLNIIPFNELLECALLPSEEYDVSKWLFVPNAYDEYRYILGTRGKNPLICIGINPSTAKPDDLDNTLKSVERIALGNGYDSFIMFNVYAQRATKPSDMDTVLNAQLHKENMAAFEYILSSCKDAPPCIWAAWGNIIEMRPYLKDCVSDMLTIGNKYSARWFSCGAISKKGHPHHPLYLRSDSPLDSFDADLYLRSTLKSIL